MSPRQAIARLHALAERWEQSVHTVQRIDGRDLRAELDEIEAHLRTEERE